MDHSHRGRTAQLETIQVDPPRRRRRWLRSRAEGRVAHFGRLSGVFAAALLVGLLGATPAAALENGCMQDVYEAYNGGGDLSTGCTANDVRISGDLVRGGDVSSFAWAPDSSRIAYIADQDTDTVSELYTSTPEGAANNVKVSGDMQPLGDVEIKKGYQWVTP